MNEYNIKFIFIGVYNRNCLNYLYNNSIKIKVLCLAESNVLPSTSSINSSGI